MIIYIIIIIYIYVYNIIILFVAELTNNSQGARKFQVAFECECSYVR